MGNKILGHLVYFSLADLLVDPATFEDACRLLGRGFKMSSGLSGGDSFQRAIPSLKLDLTIKGVPHSIYFRQSCNPYTYELVEEIRYPNRDTRQIIADVAFNKELNALDIRYAIEPPDHVTGFMNRAEDACFCYQGFAGTKQAESIALAYLDSLEATKINFHGRVYFIPRTHISNLPAFLGFMRMLNRKKISKPELICNSLPVPDCPVQKDSIAADFCMAFTDNANSYIREAEYLLESHSPSMIIKRRWYHKIDRLMCR